MVGTEGFHAPEMWDEKPYTSKADIFSLGVTYMIVLMHQESLRKINEILGEGRLTLKLTCQEDHLSFH